MHYKKLSYSILLTQKEMKNLEKRSMKTSKRPAENPTLVINIYMCILCNISQLTNFI